MKNSVAFKMLHLLTIFFVIFSLFPGWPEYFNKNYNLILPETEKAEASDFQIKTGTYVGGGTSTTTVSGVGFQPDLIFIKADKIEAANSGIFYTSSMSATGDGAYLGSAIVNSATAVTGVYSDGFYVGPSNADTNVNLVVYQYVAIKGTTTNFKVGTYSGNGADDRLIDIGFQPDLVITKANATTAAVWRSSTMVGDTSQYFTTTAASANLIQSLDSSGFTLGSDNAVNAGSVTFYYIALKNNASTFKVGSYTGNNTDDTSIAGVGFTPNFVWTKSASTRAAVMRTDGHMGDSSNTFVNGGIAANKIQSFGNDYFQIGNDAGVNTNAEVYHYVAFGGYSPSLSGSFSFKTGYYVGSGTAWSVTGLGFKPELVLIKSEDNSGAMVIKTSLMSGANATLITGVAAGSTYVTSLDDDGFTLGTADATNKLGILFQWMAFSGVDKSDFKIGAYTGNGVDDRQINVGFQPDLVWVKAATNASAVWASSATSSDWTNYFTNTAGSNNIIQQLNSTGFQLGTTNVNTNAVTYFYVAFKSSANKLKVGSYAGDVLDDKVISDVGFRPDAVFVKAVIDTTAARPVVFRTQEHQGDSSVSVSTAFNNSINNIQDFLDTGFQVGTSVYVNGSGKDFYYFAFGGATDSISKTGSYYFNSGSYTGNGTSVAVTGVGFVPDMVIVKDTLTGDTVLKTSHMGDSVSVGMAEPAAAKVNRLTFSGSKGFTVGSDVDVNVSGRTYYWYAFGNSGCENFKIGAYAANGGGDRDILGMGFQPDLVSTVSLSNALGAWRTSQWTGDSSLRFYATASSTEIIKSMQTDGFRVGTDLAVKPTNAKAVVYFTFKKLVGYFNVGGYTGNGLDNQEIVGVGFQPDLIWIKSASDISSALHRTRDLAGDSSQYFMATANAANLVQSFLSDGFQIGAGVGVNTNATNYYWATWRQIPPDLQQLHYRWRNDDGNEANATFSVTEDTALANVEKNTVQRLRVEIANKGYSSDSSAYRLDYGVKETTCSAISTWTAIPVTATTEHWSMADSVNITNADTTTNVSNGLTDGNATFVFGQTMDTSNPTGGLTVDPTEFTEIEYSIKATANATGGGNYCFRLSRSADTSNFTYTTYPEASVKSGAVAISITTDGVVDFGEVDFNSTASTSESGVETINVDSGPVNLSMSASDFISGTSTWLLGESNGENQVKFEFSTSTNPSWIVFSASGTPFTLDNNVTQGQTRDLFFQITLPTIPAGQANYSQFSSVVTITATAP